MNEISLKGALPRVFVGRDDTHSEVWLSNLTLERGKHYMVSAQSGTGKSSLCSYVYGYRVDYEGTIAFDGRNIKELSVDEWCQVRCREIAYLPQELMLFAELTALENVQLKNRLTDFKTEAEIVSLFAELGIEDKLNSPVGKLSIGQQQRVAIVRTLCQPAHFVLLDEPVSHLDEKNNRIVANLIQREAAAQGAGIVATSVGNNLMIDVDKYLEL